MSFDISAVIELAVIYVHGPGEAIKRLGEPDAWEAAGVRPRWTTGSFRIDPFPRVLDDTQRHIMIEFDTAREADTAYDNRTTVLTTNFPDLPKQHVTFLKFRLSPKNIQSRFHAFRASDFAYLVLKSLFNETRESPPLLLSRSSEENDALSAELARGQALLIKCREHQSVVTKLQSQTSSEMSSLHRDLSTAEGVFRDCLMMNGELNAALDSMQSRSTHGGISLDPVSGATYKQHLQLLQKVQELEIDVELRVPKAGSIDQRYRVLPVLPSRPSPGHSHSTL